MTINHDIFTAPRYLRNPMLQTLLSSSGLRRLGRNEMLDNSQEVIVDAGDGVKLQGFHSSHGKELKEKGLVIMLHGWEGSADSAYIVNTGKRLFRSGYDIFRLNLRDHGSSHGLNRGLFLGTLIDESLRAVRRAAMDFGRGPVFLVGFSMGGNFALRMARLCGKNPIQGLKRVVCINPPLDPLDATRNIDGRPLIKKYFLKKWKRSLAINQALYPELYDFGDIMAMDTCMEMTEQLIRRYTDYGNAADYFGRYTLKEGYLDAAAVPLSVITAEDDPIINVNHFREAKLNDRVSLIIHPNGGHCGYINGLRLSSWYQDWMLRLFGSEFN